MKKFNIIILILLIVNILTIVFFCGLINKDHTSVHKSESNICMKVAYYINGQGDRWELNDGVLIVDSDKCFFANAMLKNIAKEEIVLKSNKISIEERNKNNEVVSYLFSRVVTSQMVDDTGKISYSYQENIEPYKSIQIFEGLTPKQSAIYYKDIVNNDLYLVFQYTDKNNIQSKEEIKLKKQIFNWN